MNMYEKFLEKSSEEILTFDSSNIKKANDFLNKYLGFSYSIIYNKYCNIINYFIVGRNIPNSLKLYPGYIISIIPGKTLRIVDPYSYLLN
jgi:hypothetical protein